MSNWGTIIIKVGGHEFSFKTDDGWVDSEPDWQKLQLEHNLSDQELAKLQFKLRRAESKTREDYRILAEMWDET